MDSSEEIFLLLMMKEEHPGEICIQFFLNVIKMLIIEIVTVCSLSELEASRQDVVVAN